MTLSAKREALGLSVEEVAERLKLDPTVVEAWEAGDKQPTRTPQQMQALCSAYQVNLDELVALVEASPGE